MKSYRITCAFIGWLAIALQYYIVAHSASEWSLPARTLNFLSYFTIQSNILVALAFLLPVLVPHHRSGQFFLRASVRGGIALYIAVTGLVYFVVLRHVWQPTGLQWLVDVTLHYLMPILYMLDWLVFTRKQGLRYANVPRWLIFPFAYFLYCLLHGAVSGFYPYPFIDVSALGYGQVVLNAVGMLLFFSATGLLLVGLSRFFKRRTFPCIARGDCA